MLYNKNRQTVAKWMAQKPHPDSTCPECDEPLVARAGEIVTWHWAHKPGCGAGCYHEETAWHLRMKAAYLTFPGWDAEVPVKALGRTYYADAMCARTGKIREFVHSLSDFYRIKHKALLSAGYDVLWIFDGAVFVSERRRRTRNGGYRLFLKPKASAMHDAIGGLVHWDDALWKYKAGYGSWFQCNGEQAHAVVMRLCQTPQIKRQRGAST